MPKFRWPPPAEELRRVQPEYHVLRAGSVFARIYPRGGQHPSAWNQFRSVGPLPGARFDHHIGGKHIGGKHIGGKHIGGKHIGGEHIVGEHIVGEHIGGEQRSVMYGAPGLVTCVAEVFQGSRVVDRAADDRFLAAVAIVRSARLLDLTGDWPTRAGASQAISSGPRTRAQAWARAIYDAYPTIEGVWYPSSMHGGHRALMLFDRAQDALSIDPEIDVPLSHPGLLPDLVRAANTLGYLIH